MTEAQSPYVARPGNVEALKALWSEAQGGTPRVVRLQAPFGGGRRALVGEFIRQVGAEEDDAILWRVNCLDQENGLQWLVRMYGSLVATLSTDALRKGRAEMVLNAQLPSQPKRVQNWYQQFVSTLKEAKADTKTGQVQLRLPQDNPLIGLVEVVAALSRKSPVFLELQNAQVVNSLALSIFVEALASEAERGSKLMILLYDEQPSEVTKALYPMPLLDYYERGEAKTTVQQLEPWTSEDVQTFLERKGLSSDAARIAEITTGRPGFIAELIEILEENEQLADDLSAVTLSSLVPMAVDEDEIEATEPTEPKEGERRPAGAQDAGRVAYLAALLGQAFPSALVADMGGFERESVDDLIDAMEDLYEEVQFSKEMNTWVYRFKRGCWREGVIEQNNTDESHNIARNVGLFMERFLVPRGYGFVMKTARVYAEHGEAGRANMLRSVALSQDAPDIWGLCYDFIRYFDEAAWPDTLRKTVWMNLLERLVGGGNVQAAEKVHAEATEWATDNDEREMTAWLLFMGSRLDARRQDLYRARDRANDALKLYEVMENKAKVAEIHNHLAQIELQDGNPNVALEQVTAALEAGKVTNEEGKDSYLPQVIAQAEHIRGMVARRQGQLKEAGEHFQRANEIAGQTGQAALALDAGLSFGEALLAARNTSQARDVLKRVVQIASSLRNPGRERSASELLSQAEAAERNFDEAIQAGTRTLQLTQQLQLQQAMPIDLYNLGFFHFAAGKHNEALVFLKQAEGMVDQLGEHPLVKELYYFKGMAHLQSGEDADAQTSLDRAKDLAEQHEDWGKLASSLEHLAGLAHKGGDAATAKSHLNRAIELATQHDVLKEARKGLRRKLDALS